MCVITVVTEIDLLGPELWGPPVGVPRLVILQPLKLLAIPPPHSPMIDLYPKEVPKNPDNARE